MASRKPLSMKQDKNGQMWAVYFWHPLRDKSVRIPLGLAQSTAQTALDWLNKIFLNKSDWRERPQDVPVGIWELWVGGERALPPPDPDESVGIALAAQGESDYWKTEYDKLFEKYQSVVKQLEHERGKKIRQGPCPSLQNAFDKWIGEYKGRDADWTKIVTNDLKRFVAHFTPALPIDDLSGRERDIATWLRSLDVGAGRRQQMRRIVLRLLDDSGVVIDKNAVAKVGKTEVRNDRGQIRWLLRDQAEKVKAALAAPWCDYFAVQVATGMRPDELITLKRSDFDGAKFDEVALSPLGVLSLKQGSRRIRIPPGLRTILKERFADNDILFPDPATGKPWQDPKAYNRQYRKALKKAGTAAGVTFKMDCRVPRRTCASLLLRDGVSIESVAALLGDDPKTIREHYASILSHEVSTSAGTLKAVKKVK